MKKRYILLIIIALCVGLYWLVYPTYSWNQKLTLTIQTPDGEKTGSAVVKVWVSYRPQILPDSSGVSNKWRGEATVVDLGEERYVFALLNKPQYLVQDVFKHLVSPDPKFAKYSSRYVNTALLFPKLKYMRVTAPVRFTSNYPTLVTFDDVSDPASVKLIDPHDLAATFGEGYSLKAMTLEITNEPVTKAVVDLILGKWLNNYYNKRLDGLRFQTIKSKNQFANSLASGVFDTEKE